MLQRGAARISMNRLHAACLLLKGGSGAVCSVQCGQSMGVRIAAAAAEATKLPAC
jgi:hypothetical protein